MTQEDLIKEFDNNIPKGTLSGFIDWGNIRDFVKLSFIEGEKAGLNKADWNAETLLSARTSERERILKLIEEISYQGDREGFSDREVGWNQALEELIKRINE